MKTDPKVVQRFERNLKKTLEEIVHELIFFHVLSPDSIERALDVVKNKMNRPHYIDCAYYDLTGKCIDYGDQP